MKYPKKLIEVALPLDDISRQAAKEKSIRNGHPSTFHQWWSRKPLAAARAVLFAQLVNDPAEMPNEKGNSKSKQEIQRERDHLFDIIRDLVKWENLNNENVLKKARSEILKSWEYTCKLTGNDSSKLPSFWDPFCGGGSIPLEAQRLGLEAYASDLNPVAVMITKALLEIPPKFAGRGPIGPMRKGTKQSSISATQRWIGAEGLAEDVLRYGLWMREQAFERIGHLYPQVDLPRDYGGGKGTVIAWLWARTVKSPNPAFNRIGVPLATKWWLSSNKGKEAWVEPVITESGTSYHFEVRTGNCREVISKNSNGTGFVGAKGKKTKAAFRCLLSGSPITGEYIDSEANAGGLGAVLMAIAVESSRRRIYLPPEFYDPKEIEDHINRIMETKSLSKTLPTQECRGTFASNAQGRRYGFFAFKDYFTPRQLIALVTFCDLVVEARERIIKDAKAAGWEDDGRGLEEGGTGATAYADAVAVYLAFVIDKVADLGNTLCGWEPIAQCPRHLFGRQGITMQWDYAESNPFSESSGSLKVVLEGTVRSMDRVVREAHHRKIGKSFQSDITSSSALQGAIVSTDPPYYNNVSYSDLSDFFYIWLRRSLGKFFPELFATVLTPKSSEIIADLYRSGGKEQAALHFLESMTKALRNIGEQGSPFFPITLYYAFKQSASTADGVMSTGWETFIGAVIRSGFCISGTWPMRTENASRMVGQGTNALASSIILVCRRRPDNAPSISRKQFMRELEQALPGALEDMMGSASGASPIAPVDLAQAAIGPGMEVYSKYSGVLEADGSTMSIGTALTQINKALDEYFSNAESNMDSETRFCVDWFQQHGYKLGLFGDADVLARAKGTSVDAVQTSGVLESGSGKVRLLRFSEYLDQRNRRVGGKLCVWEGCHALIRALQQSQSQAGILLSELSEKSEPIRQLAYRLYTLCERKGWAEDARVYNDLITNWRVILDIARENRRTERQDELGF